MNLETLQLAKNYADGFVTLYNAVNGKHFPFKNSLSRFPYIPINRYNADTVLFEDASGTHTPTFNDGGIKIETDDKLSVSVDSPLIDNFGIGLSCKTLHAFNDIESSAFFLSANKDFPTGQFIRDRIQVRKMPTDDWGNGRIEFNFADGGTGINERVAIGEYLEGDELGFYISKEKDKWNFYVGGDNGSVGQALSNNYTTTTPLNHIIVGANRNFGGAAPAIYKDLKIDETPNPEQYFNKKLFGQPLMVLSWDDGFLTDYTRAHKVLQKYNVKGTTYINGSRQGNTGRMTWAQIKEMYESGLWDIQCHGYTHPYMTQLTDEELVDQMVDQNNIFEANDIPTPTHFAYPFGDLDARTHGILKEYRHTLRGTGRAINTYAIDELNTKSWTFDANGVGSFENAKELMDTTAETGSILFTYMHEMDQEREDFLEDVVKYGIKLGIKFVTVSEFYQLTRQK